MSIDPRATLQRLCSERRESLAGLSRLLGRNEAYIQQYLRKGSPRRLPEAERRTLARYFAIPDSMLGGPVAETAMAGGAMVAVRRCAVRASAGAGAAAEDSMLRPHFAFDPGWLRALTATPSERLAVIRVEGDSMAPTLNAGDDLLIDHADPDAGLRDGVYVLRVDGALLVKRLAVHPLGGRVTVQSDNPNYPDWPDRELDELTCVGRVIWSGRRIA